ncbi:MAG: hypothetical protein VXZ31_08510, partial [Pseudomonadota bacterium]|nr:hypothetical protein [Pseudomonadota bacterium]
MICIIGTPFFTTEALFQRGQRWPASTTQTSHETRLEALPSLLARAARSKVSQGPSAKPAEYSNGSAARAW